MTERRNLIEQTQSVFGLLRTLNMVYPIWHCFLDIPEFPRQSGTILRYRERLAERIYPNVLSMHQAMAFGKERINPYLNLLPDRLLKFISGFEGLQRVGF